MDDVQRLGQIRSLICKTFSAFGGSMDRMPRETLLIRDGFFCGRRFESDGLQAVWFTEENEVKFFDRNGAILRVVGLASDNLQVEHQRAA
jgi:hypothetical protein